MAEAHGIRTPQDASTNEPDLLTLSLVHAGWQSKIAISSTGKFRRDPREVRPASRPVGDFFDRAHRIEQAYETPEGITAVRPSLLSALGTIRDVLVDGLPDLGPPGNLHMQYAGNVMTPDLVEASDSYFETFLRRVTTEHLPNVVDQAQRYRW
jgi:hypothetical protein